MNMRTIGIDLGKTVFHVVGLDHAGNVVMKRRLSKSQLLRQLVNTPPCLIGYGSLLRRSPSPRGAGSASA
jgi:transposase